MPETQLRKLNRIAANKNPKAVVTYTKKGGYLLVLNGTERPLGNDSVHARFYLEQILEEV